MNKKIVTIIILLLFTINIIIGSFFIFTLNAIDIPKINTFIEILDINEDEIIIKAQIDMNNPNFFSFTIDDFSIISKTSDGKELGTIIINGGNIQANTNETFYAEASFTLHNYDFKPIYSNISGLMALNIFGLFEKKIPIKIDVIASLDRLIDTIHPPEIIISAAIDKITEEGIIFNGNITIMNTNNFEIILKEFSSEIANDAGLKLGEISIPNSYVKPKETKDIALSANLSYEALGADTIILGINTKVGACIAGLNKTINVSTKAEIDVPDVKNLLFFNEIMDFSIVGDFNIRFQGIVTTVGLKIYNPTDIPFEAKNLVCSISGLTNNKTVTIAEGPMNPCAISSHKEVCIQTIITMKYQSILTAGIDKLIPDWFVLSVVGDFSIQNTNQSIPISINAYIDPNPFI
jgi:hypothetical protein